MPGMTGDKMALEMLGIRGDIPIILSTGFSESMTREKIEKLGIRALLMKPVSMDILAKTLRSVLDNSFSGGKTHEPALYHL
jgi:DNA-binding NarL/FixJ family response regulator